MRFYGKVAYHAYEGPAIDLAEQARLVRDLGTCDVMFLRNHGILACGRSVAETFNILYWLEMACKAQVDCMAANTELVLPDPEVAAKTAHLYEPATRRVYGAMEWEAMLRQLDRDDPSYRS
jgi:ribulose-5-phosphate 4-epimerase/fuculose-1-phosphate aldolase